MVSVAFPTILSVSLVILLGFILSRTLLGNEAFWSGVSRLCYWILFSISLFDIISETSLSGGVVLPIILILTSALIGIILLPILACYLSGFDRNSASSVIQGSFRHNGFISFAIPLDCWVQLEQSLRPFALLFWCLLPILQRLL